MRVATYNVWNEEKGKSGRFDQLKKEIMRINADIIGLQEVTPRFYEEVLQAMGYEYCIYHEYPWEREGLAILSRYPIIEYKTLYDLAEFEKSRAICALLDIHGIHVSYSNVHLPWDSVLEREKQIIAINRYIHEMKADFSILLGDFNGNLDSSVNRFLTGNQSLNGFEAAPCWNELASAYVARNGAKVRPTLDPVHNPRWTGKMAPFEPMVMDRIYVMESWNTVELKSVEVFGTEISEENQLAPSDHYGVFAEIEFRK